jgi:PAS domain S-box-containing protein
MNPHDDFSSLFEFLPIGAYRSSPEGRQLRANPALVRLNGFASEAEQVAAVQGIAGEWYVDPNRRAAFLALLERDGRVVGFESEVYRRKTRERIWINETAHAVRNAAERLLYIEGTVEEITERVRQREATRHGEARLRQILDLVPGMVYRAEIQPDLTLRLTFASSGTREVFGVGPEEAMRDVAALDRMRHPDDAARLGQVLREAARERKPVRTVYRAITADGTLKWLQVQSEPAPPEEGREVRVGLVMDVSAQIRHEEALRENSELWRRALESTGDGMWDWSAEGRVHFSPTCLALYGFVSGELEDRPDAMDERVHPDDLPAMQAARQAHMAGDAPAYVNEHRMRCKDGRWKWVLSRGVVISRAADGSPLRMIGTHTDITSRKLAEELKLERDSAAAADRAKSRFLSRVSHELRTPLNAILGFSQLLEMESSLDERQRGWVKQVLTSGRHLLGLMDDILDLSSAQTGQLPVYTEAVRLRPVLDEVWAMLAAAAAAAGVTFVEATQPDEPLAVRADRKRLKQVLANVIGNAIKYNRRGGHVRLATECVGDTVRVHVADDGPGFDDEQRERLFQPFERLGAQHGDVPGTGLGLALCRQLMEAMGGSIRAESTPGQGATFTIELPGG